MAADFVLETKLEARTTDIDSLINDVQKEFDSKRIAVKFDKQSVVDFVNDVKDKFENTSIKLNLDFNGGIANAKSGISKINSLLLDIQKLTSSGNFAGSIKAYEQQIKDAAKALSGLVHQTEKFKNATAIADMKKQLAAAFSTGDPAVIEQTFNRLVATYRKIPGITRDMQKKIINEFTIGYERRTELMNQEYNFIKGSVDKIAAYSKKYSKDGIIDAGNKEQQMRYLDELAQRYQDLSDVIKQVYSDPNTFDESAVRSALDNTNLTLEQQEAVLKSIKSGWDGVHDAAIRANSAAQSTTDKEALRQSKETLKEISSLMSNASALRLKLISEEDKNVIAEIDLQLNAIYDDLNKIAPGLGDAFKSGDVVAFEAALNKTNLTSEQRIAIMKALKSATDKQTLAEKEHAAAAQAAAQRNLTMYSRMTSGIKRFISTFMGIYGVIGLIRSVYDNVLTLDKAIVNLQIATNGSREATTELVREYSKLGQQLGVSTVDISNAAVAWLRQGNDIETTNKLIVASTMLSKLGMIDASEATTDLTSVMKGYGITVDGVIGIVDKLTAVDLKAATSAGDIATAMQKTAVTANQLGIPLNRLIGMVATLSEVSQQSPETVGTGMKSLLARMVNIKAGYLEDPETGESLNNVEAALRGVGISLRDVNGEFRNTGEVLGEIADKWKEMDKLHQNAVAVAMGGTRQQENVRILMEYWDKVVELTEVAGDSAGTAEQKFKAVTEGIEARIESLKAAWQRLSKTVVDSNLINGIVSGVTFIINLLDKLGGSITTLVGVLATLGVALFNIGVKSALMKGATFGEAITSGIIRIKTSIVSLVTSIKTKLIPSLVATGQAMYAALGPWGIFAAVVVAVGAAVAAVTINLIKSSKSITEKYEEAKEKFDEATKSLETNKSKLEEIGKQIEANEQLKGTAKWTDTIAAETAQLHLEYLELQAVNEELERNRKLNAMDTLENYAGTYGANGYRETKVSANFVRNLVSKHLGISAADATIMMSNLEGEVSDPSLASVRKYGDFRSILYQFAGLGISHNSKEGWLYSEQNAEEYLDALISSLNIYEKGSREYNEAMLEISSIAKESIRGIREYEGLVDGTDLLDMESEAYETYLGLIDRYNKTQDALGTQNRYVSKFLSEATSNEADAEDVGEKTGGFLSGVIINIEKERDAYDIVTRALREDIDGVEEATVTVDEFKDASKELIEAYGDLYDGTTVGDAFEAWSTIFEDGTRDMSSEELLSHIERLHYLAEARAVEQKRAEGILSLIEDIGDIDGGVFGSVAEEDSAIASIRKNIDDLEGVSQEFKDALYNILDAREYVYTDTDGKRAFYDALIDAFSLDEEAERYIQESWRPQVEELVEKSTRTLVDKFKESIEDIEGAIDSDSLSATKNAAKEALSGIFDVKSDEYKKISTLIDNIGRVNYTVEDFKHDVASLAADTEWAKFINFDWMDTTTIGEKVNKFEESVSKLAKAEDVMSQRVAKEEIMNIAGQLFGEDSNVYGYINSLVDLVINGSIGIDDFKGEIYSLFEAAAEINPALQPLLDALNFDWKKIRVPPTVKDAFSALQDVFNADWSVDKEKALEELGTVVTELAGSDVSDSLIKFLRDANIPMEKNSIIDMIIEFLKTSNIKNAEELVKHLEDIKDVVEGPSNKGAFSAVKEFLEADWNEDKAEAIKKMAEAAKEFGIDPNKIASFEQLMSMMGDTDRDNFIDSIIESLKDLDDPKYQELIDKLLELKSSPPTKKKANELADDFISAVSGFNENGSVYQKLVGRNAIQSAIGAIAGTDSKEYMQVSMWLTQLQNGAMTIEDFKNKVYELAHGTAWSNFIPPDWKKQIPETSEKIKGIIEQIQSLQKASTQDDRDNIFKKIKEDVESLNIADEAKQMILGLAESLRTGNMDATEFGNTLWEIAGILEEILGIPIRRYLEDAFAPAATEAEKAKKAVEGLEEKLRAIKELEEGSVAKDNATLLSRVSDDLSVIAELQELAEGGGVDPFRRPIVTGAELIAAGWDDLDPDELATVYSVGFGNEDDSIVMNFTPIFVRDDGSYEILSPEAIEDYAAEVIEGVHDDYLGLRIGMPFTGDNAVERAIEAAERFHELQEQFYLGSENMMLSATGDGAGGGKPTLSGEVRDEYGELVKVIPEEEALNELLKSRREEAYQNAKLSEDEIKTLIELYPSLAAQVYAYNAALDAGLPYEEIVARANALKEALEIAERSGNANNLVSGINNLVGADSGFEKSEAIGKIAAALTALGYAADSDAYKGVMDLIASFNEGTVSAEKFKEMLYQLLSALGLGNYLPEGWSPGSIDARTAFMKKDFEGGYGGTGIGGYSENLRGALYDVYNLHDGDQLSQDSIDALVQKFPFLIDEIKEFQNGEITARELWDELANAIANTEFDDTASSLQSLMKIIDGSEEGTYEYAEAVEALSDVFLDTISEADMPQYFDEIREMLNGSEEAFKTLQGVVAAGLESQWNLDAGSIMNGLVTVQQIAEQTGLTADEVNAKLSRLGMFTTKRIDLSGVFTGIEAIMGKVFPSFKFPKTLLGGYVDVIVPTDENPIKKPSPKGGGSKGNKGGGKTSILSEQYTNDKGLYDSLIDNLKNLNNLYEEGSEEWLRNQQRIIETYQAYAKTVKDEYDRLTEAGVSMVDKEMQTLSKDLLKVNKELYDAAKDYWEAVRDNMKKSMEHVVDQMDAVLDLRKAHKDLLTELRQENRELEKQYKIAQDEAAHPGLTEGERELLFSTEDYKRLTGMLQDISKQADALYEEYRNKIASVTEDETYAVEYITEEYERQLGLLESQYEIAKQQLAVEKARQELQNTLRERNTAVLINGAWTWMADPDAVQAAMDKVADAEIELEDAITDAEFNKETAEIETARDAIKSSIDAMEALEFAIEDLAEGIVDLADAINENIFNAIGTTSRNYLNQTKGHGLELFKNELTELQETSGLVFSNTDVEKLYSLLSSGNTLNSSNIFDDSIIHDSSAIASILSNTTNNASNGGNVIYINGIHLSDADSELLLNALDRVAYTWQVQ